MLDVLSRNSFSSYLSANIFILLLLLKEIENDCIIYRLTVIFL